MRISGKTYSILFPIVLAAIFVVTLAVMRKTVLTEILVSSCIVSVVYFLFSFICLYFNIGTKKTSAVSFSDVPGLTKTDGWFSKVASLDFSGAIDFASGADHPVGWVLGFLLSIVVSILLPILLAIAIFVLSGGIELIIFVAAIISYFSFYQILRYQLVKRRKTKFRFFPSLGYSLLFTVSAIGLVPIGLEIFMRITGKI
jgi:hypothetical protein